jgi:hypothetical protein
MIDLSAFDLEKLLVPDWAKSDAPKDRQRLEQLGERPDRGGFREGGRPQRGAGGSGGPRGPRPNQGGGSGPARGPRRDQPAGRRDDRPSTGRGPGGPGGPREQRGPAGSGRPAQNRDAGPRRPERPAPLPKVEIKGWELDMIPDHAGVESMIRQIRETARTFPLFELGRMVIKKNDRYTLAFRRLKHIAGPEQFWHCGADNSLWLSQEEAVQHVLRRHLNTFYKSEQVTIDPPKGNFSGVAVCGLSGVVLGPPNVHDYQLKLRKLYTERFSRMPFDFYRTKIQIVKDEATLEKWKAEQSVRTEYLPVDAEEPRFTSLEEVEKHFIATKSAEVIKAVEADVTPSVRFEQLGSSKLRASAAAFLESQRRFPLSAGTGLGREFTGAGLYIFKAHGNVTYVTLVRPRYLDRQSAVLSDGITRILDFLEQHPKTTSAQLVQALSGITAAAAPKTPAAPAEGAKETAAEPAKEQPAAVSPEAHAAATAVVSDLSWLLHQGHVIDFVDVGLELARKPKPKPVAPAKAEGAAPAAVTEAAVEETAEAPEADPIVEETAVVADPVAPAPVEAPKDETV